MKSLRRDLTITLGIANCAMIVVGGLAIYFLTRSVLREQFDDILTAKATALITATEIDDDEFEIDLTVQDFAGFGSGGQDYFEIRRENGRVLAASPSLSPSTVKLQKDPDLPQGMNPRMFTGSLGDGRPARFYLQRFVPKDDEDHEHRDLYLIAASPMKTLQDSLLILGIVVAGVGTLVMVAIPPLLLFLLGRGLRPVAHLRDQVRAIPPSRLDMRLDLGGQPEELQPLGASLNEWLGRLEESFERERRFSSHAAHELRTPLAELKMMAEIGATWPDQATPERCAEMIKVTDELEALLEKLSLLARADSGNLPVQIEPVDLEKSISTMVERFSSKAMERGLVIEPVIKEGEFRSDPVLWSAILQNLIGNAVSHAPRGSVIRIEASPEGVTTINPAPDLKKEDLSRLFERFWRKNQSHRGESHSGLGLSIIRACVGLLGGASNLSLGEGNELRVEIQWPKTRANAAS